MRQRPDFPHLKLCLISRTNIGSQNVTRQNGLIAVTPPKGTGVSPKTYGDLGNQGSYYRLTNRKSQKRGG